MIYNLVQYIKNSIAGYEVTCNGWQAGTTDRAANVSESGGDPHPWIKRNDFNIQIIARAKVKTTARVDIMAIYTLLHKHGWAGLTLPSATVDSIIYPAVKVWKIVAVQLPGYIGADANGREEFSVNFTITTE